jgi:Fe-Mn family superoxide dismutase
MMTRREVIKAVALTAGALAVNTPFLRGAAADSSASTSVYPFKLPELGYPYDALEPYIDAQTMQIHHDKHNGAYVENLNKALAQAPESVQKMSLEELLLNLDKVPENIRTAETFGDYPAFQAKFGEAATKVFGSGWAWLVTDGKKLSISTTPNQDSTISKPNDKEIPIVGIDVWEHAYYLKYQNRRPEYVKAFWNVINWDYAGEQYAAASKG